MEAELVPIDPDTPPVDHFDPDDCFTDATRRDLASARNPRTERAYDRWWKMALSYCAEHGSTPMPMTAATLTNFVQWLTTLEARTPQGKPLGRPYSRSSLGQAIAAVRTAHSRAGAPKPDTQAAWTLIEAHARKSAASGRRKKQSKPVTLALVQQLTGACDPGTVKGRRDALVLALGYGLMGRRSEISDVDIEHVRLDGAWVQVWIPFSKTDQSGEGETVSIPALLGRGIDLGALLDAVLDDLASQGITEGALIRGVDRWGRYRDRLKPESVNDIVKGLAKELGLSGITAHGLRAGGPTDAAERGAHAAHIAEHGRWSKTSTQVMTYIRPVDKRKNNPLLGG